MEFICEAISYFQFISVINCQYNITLNFFFLCASAKKY